MLGRAQAVTLEELNPRAGQQRLALPAKLLDHRLRFTGRIPP
jgi:hypothetical protein